MSGNNDQRSIDFNTVPITPIIEMSNDEWKEYWNPNKYVFYFFDNYN